MMIRKSKFRMVICPFRHVIFYKYHTLDGRSGCIFIHPIIGVLLKEKIHYAHCVTQFIEVTVVTCALVNDQTCVGYRFCENLPLPQGSVHVLIAPKEQGWNPDSRCVWKQILVDNFDKSFAH